MKDLLKKKINVKELSRIHGGDSFKNSGGTEKGKTGGGCDSYEKTIDDNCCLSYYKEINVCE